MRLTVLFLALILSVNISHAQEIKSSRVRHLRIRNATPSFISAVSPNGEYFLVTEGNYRGLYMVKPRGGRAVKITDNAGAGYEPSVSEDGKIIIFRSDEIKEGRRFFSLTRYDRTAASSGVMTEKTREMSAPLIVGSSVHYMANGEERSFPAGNTTRKSGEEQLYVLNNDLTPILVRNGIQQPFMPGGPGSYIWVSLSPDRSRMLYYMAGKGAYISTLDGRVIASAGMISAPKWLNNEIIIGMTDKDDGYRVTESEIVAYNITSGKLTRLTTTSDRAEMHPFPFQDGKKIIFQTPEGDIYSMDIVIK